MSLAALRWARRVPPSAGPAGASVLRLLADRANENGVCWPSVARIAKETNLSRRTVFRALADLEALDLIERRYTGRSSTYRVCFEGPRNLSLEDLEVSQWHTRGDTVAHQGCHGDTQSSQEVVWEARVEPIAECVAMAREWLESHR